VARRIRRLVGEGAPDVPPVTVSIGVACFPGDADAKDELIGRADMAMYAAKRAGRDRVRAFSNDLEVDEREPVGER